MPLDWDHYWQESLDQAQQRSPEYDQSEFYAGGRASKQWPDKETPKWWHENGPKFVKSWVRWLAASELVLWELPDDNGELKPAIELEVWAYGPDGLMVKSVIDRVLEDPKTHDLYIVDLKTGSFTPPWPLQLALNNLCLKDTYGEVCNGASYGGFWKARQGGVTKWHDLSIYTDEWLWEQVWKAREIRDRQLFIASPNNLCNSACGVRPYCLAVGGTPPTVDSFFGTDASLTQNREGKEQE